MALFKPAHRIGKMIELTPAMLGDWGVTALLLDIDNTMTTHNNPEPAEGVQAWIDGMKNAGFSLMVVSNNNGERVRLFSQRVGLPYEGSAAKPLPMGFRRACRHLGVRPAQTAVVGDQIFTDILGGNLLGACTVMTEPYQLEEHLFFRVKRACERAVMAWWKEK